MEKTSSNRRLSAIMFTDIVGYTALMQRDETAAMELRNRHRKAFEELHQTHHGEIVQYFGDGTLSLFQSGVEAVACAVDLQRSLQQDPKVPLRIGIHTGDIVFDGTEIYGDSVNVASRIESMSIPGAILISDKLNDELKNHPELMTKSLGFFEFKNVQQPIQLFAIANDQIPVPKPGELKGKGQRLTKTIAVLPFVNRSPDPENEYFSDGMSEEIINALSKIEGLKVTSRTSSFFFKNKQVPISEVGKQLNVSTILEGSIRLAGKKMRITAQLIDVEDDVHFWSETFDRSIDDVFAVQDEISLLIADRLREYLGHFEISDKLVDTPSVPVDAYKRYLQGRFHVLKMTPEEIEKGMSILQDLINDQPDYALAHLGINLGFTLLGTMGYIPAQEAFTEGQVHLDKAIELNDQLQESQLNLSYMAFLQDWDLQSTYKHLNKAGEIRKTVEFYQSMASVLVAEGKFMAAMNYIDTALQIDPFSGINYHLKGFIYYTQEQYSQAIEFFKESTRLNPIFMATNLYHGQALILMDKPKEALMLFEQLPTDGTDLARLGGITMAQAALGNTEAAKAGINTLESALQSDKMERAMNMLINCQALLGNTEETLSLIEKGIEFRLPMLVYLNVEPLLRPLHGSKQFQRLMKSILGSSTTAEPTPRKYKKALFTRAELKRYRKALEELMAQEQPYLDLNLTLRTLAEQLDLSANQLSQLLNEGFDKNFAEYVNTYRLETFKSLATDPSKSHLTILALAYESGFNSKTVFNTFFKKAMGMTPSKYWKSMHS
jgi:TolB-like protein/class 3 adenylate cyclase/AraC-like DNA-binding protein